MSSNERIAEIVGANDVVLFMKGTPLFPQCGFSSKAIAILEHLGVQYATVDVLHSRIGRVGSLGITTFEELKDFGTRKSNTRNRRDLEST